MDKDERFLVANLKIGTFLAQVTTLSGVHM